jgi:hypothetical protein
VCCDHISLMEKALLTQGLVSCCSDSYFPMEICRCVENM